ncbi:MAG: rod shape-determining protein MreC [Deltaproteobacteria bacterium]|nr:rod shape-determining protein MreC [Deltaproteobacteria bacterium]MBI4373488.1 rod shape-determining protein MreC [Deltaproteobacteria bacterium]
MPRDPSSLRKYRFILLCVGFISIPGFLYYQSFHGAADPPRWDQRFFVWILSPLFQSVRSIQDEVARNARRYVYLVETEKRNEALEAELKQYQLKEFFCEGISKENDRLLSLVNFQKRLPFSSIAARVIGFSPVGEFQVLTVDRGEEIGVRRGAAVLSEQGLIGRVIRVFPRQAQVLLITDPTSVVDAEIKRNGARGLIVGKGISIGFSREVFVGAFELWEGSQEVQEGDLLVTSGMDGVFPKEIPIGTAKHLRKGEHDVFLEGELLPFVDFYKLREVLIIQH